MDETFEHILPHVLTPHKYDRPILEPTYRDGDFDSHLVDCPFVFKHGDRYLMIYIGWDGKVYRTGLASSGDLLHWNRERMILDVGPEGNFDAHSAGLSWVLRDNDLQGPGELVRHNGRFLGSFLGFAEEGYEAGPGRIGLVFSDDLRHWERTKDPILRPEDGGQWEHGGLYKSCLVEHDHTFYLFYNAKDKNKTHGRWHEQTGVALSSDLEHWERYEDNPVLVHGPRGALDESFASEPCVMRMGDVWVMFYFGVDEAGRARDLVAFSDDLLHWQKHPDPVVDIGPVGTFDSIHAHKPSVIMKDGVLYHFYCSVGPRNGQEGKPWPYNEHRTIAVATSRPL